MTVVGLYWSLHQVQDAHFNEQTQTLVAHQTGGLLNPLDQSQSTASDHGGMVLSGIITGFRTPTGLGLGATTISGAKFGGEGGSTEWDFSNMFVSLGFIGGLLYLGVMGTVLVMVFRYWHRVRTLSALLLLAVLLVTLGNWLSGGQYCISTLSWICIGVLERLSRQETVAARSLHPVPLSPIRPMRELTR